MWMKIIVGILVLVVLVLMFGPREPVDLTVDFSAADLGPDLDEYLAQSEARVVDLDPAHAKSIHWAGARGQQTEFAVVYLHGFSATKEEIRPVPDKVADALGANLYFARMTGHGRNSDAMAQATVNDWINDGTEALAIGRRLGRRVVVISTSTGGTIFTLLSNTPGALENVVGTIMVSPNFGLQAGGSSLLTQPFARWFVPLLIGEERSWIPISETQARHWHTRYPTRAILPMAAAVKESNLIPVETISVPAFFIFSPDDTVVSPDATRDIEARWGGRTQIWEVPGEDVGDPSAHVLAGDIVSPQTTDAVVDAMIAWVRGLQ